MKKTTSFPPPTGATQGTPVPNEPPTRTVGGLIRSSPYVQDLRGIRFGRLIVESFAGCGARQNALWLCRCSCGNTKIISAKGLRAGSPTSCGCLFRKQASARALDELTGRRFGRLTVSYRVENSPSGATRWQAVCDCGNECVAYGKDLRSGATKSCGCFARDRLTKLNLSRKGKDHPSWNPNLTQEDRDRQRLGTPTKINLARIAQQVRRRDRATCLVCGAKNSTQVHHLEPWSQSKPLRYSRRNLVTLCKECHRQFHILYGHAGDLEDFEDFLK